MTSVEPQIELMNIGRQKLRTAIWKGTGRKRPILFFNGIGANLELVSPLGEMMADRSDVVVFDMPGIGGSPAPTMPYRPSTVVKWSNKILDELGYDDVDVMGISWGGGAAQQFALDNPERARCLVLLATSAGMAMVPGNVSALSKMSNPRRYVDTDYMMKNFETLCGDNADRSALGHKSRIIPPPPNADIYIN